MSMQFKLLTEPMHITVICTQSYKQQTTTINNKTTSLNFTKNKQNKPRDREWEHQWSDQHFSTLQDLKGSMTTEDQMGDDHRIFSMVKKTPHTFIGKKHPSEGSCIQAQGRQRFHTEMQTSAESQGRRQSNNEHMKLRSTCITTTTRKKAHRRLEQVTTYIIRHWL